MKTLVLKTISIYQKTLSPDHGWGKLFYPSGCCRFYPSCSEYTARAVKKFGVLRGMALGFWRIVRCNPWGRPDFDPIIKESR